MAYHGRYLPLKMLSAMRIDANDCRGQDYLQVGIIGPSIDNDSLPG